MKTSALFTFVFLMTAMCSIGQSSNNPKTVIDCNPTDSSMSKRSASLYRDVFETTFNVSETSVDFKRENLDTVYRKDTNTNVRIYFTLSELKDNLGVLPGLLLVPFHKDSCEVESLDNVLGIDKKGVAGTPGPISTSQMLGMSTWQQIYGNENLSNFDTVFGYNFTWETVFNACGADTNDLRVAFGVLEDTVKNTLSLHMILTNPHDENQNLTNNKVFLDFSKPCPKMCGWLITGVGTRKEE